MGAYRYLVKHTGDPNRIIPVALRRVDLGTNSAAPAEEYAHGLYGRFLCNEADDVPASAADVLRGKKSGDGTLDLPTDTIYAGAGDAVHVVPSDRVPRALLWCRFYAQDVSLSCFDRNVDDEELTGGPPVRQDRVYLGQRAGLFAAGDVEIVGVVKPFAFEDEQAAEKKLKQGLDKRSAFDPPLMLSAEELASFNNRGELVQHLRNYQDEMESTRVSRAESARRKHLADQLESMRRRLSELTAKPRSELSRSELTEKFKLRRDLADVD